MTPPVRVSWGVPVLPDPAPGESLEDRLWKEAENEAWVEKLRRLTMAVAEDLRRERDKSRRF